MAANSAVQLARLKEAGFVKPKEREGCSTCSKHRPVGWSNTYVHCNPHNAAVHTQGICPQFTPKV